MSAVSTAQRFRNKAQQDNVAVLIDDISTEADSIVVEHVSVLDTVIAKHQIILPGDRVESFSDSDTSFDVDQFATVDTLDVSDTIIVEKNQSKVLFDFVQPLDEGFITDKDLIRQRVLTNVLISDYDPPDVIVFFPEVHPVDFLQKSVERAEGIVVSRTFTDSISITDSLNRTVSGIIARILSDSVVVSEFENREELKTYIESLTTSDSNTELRLRYRLANDSVEINEIVLVTRSAINNTASTSDNFSVTDQALATFVSGLGVSAPIIHGIENQ